MTRRKLRRRFGRAARAPICPYYSIRGVLAGAYRGKDIEEREPRTHALGMTSRDGNEADKSLCNKIDSGSLVDIYGARPDGEKPTCPVCAERLARIEAKR